MSRFVLANAAARDILEIYRYIAADRLQAASKVRKRIFAAMQRIADHPGIGHTRDDLTNRPILFWPTGRYLIVYDPATRPIRIVRVLDGARDLAEIL